MLVRNYLKLMQNPHHCIVQRYCTEGILTRIKICSTLLMNIEKLNLDLTAISIN